MGKLSYTFSLLLGGIFPLARSHAERRDGAYKTGGDGIIVYQDPREHIHAPIWSTSDGSDHTEQSRSPEQSNAIRSLKPVDFSLSNWFGGATEGRPDDSQNDRVLVRLARGVAYVMDTVDETWGCWRMRAMNGAIAAVMPSIKLAQQEISLFNIYTINGKLQLAAEELAPGSSRLLNLQQLRSNRELSLYILPDRTTNQPYGVVHTIIRGILKTVADSDLCHGDVVVVHLDAAEHGLCVHDAGGNEAVQEHVRAHHERVQVVRDGVLQEHDENLAFPLLPLGLWATACV